MSGQKIVVLGTGGTIAGTSAQAGDNVGYQAGQLGVESLLEAVPGLERAAQGRIECRQIAQIDSKDLAFGVWAELARQCRAAQLDASIRAIVITHGTDTLEETAWFLHSVLDAQKPVVLTCAMRPATSLTPDGPQNLLDAMVVAATSGVAGVLVVAAGEVHGARQVQKVHPYRVQAFNSRDFGPLGWVEEGRLRPSAAWSGHGGAFTAMDEARLGDGAGWPRVDIVMSHAGADGAIVRALVRDGVQGLVVAGTGNGTVHQALETALQEARAAGVRVLRTTRCAEGQVVPQAGQFPSDVSHLPPVKARITLLLELLAAQGA